MQTLKRSWSLRIGDFARAVFWVLVVGFMLFTVFGNRGSDTQRTDLLKRFEKERGSRVISLIHRQESTSVLGVAVNSHISIEDSEAVLRAIRLTPPEQPIDLILHTPGGLVLASEQIAKALVDHKGKVTVFVPHYAMSGGTMIALAADEIVMDVNAVARRLAVAVDFECALVEIGLLNVRRTFGRGALPTVAEGLDPVALELPIKAVLEDEGPFLAQPAGVVTRWFGRLGLSGWQRGQGCEQ